MFSWRICDLSPTGRSLEAGGPRGGPGSTTKWRWPRALDIYIYPTLQIERSLYIHPLKQTVVFDTGVDGGRVFVNAALVN